MQYHMQHSRLGRTIFAATPGIKRLKFVDKTNWSLDLWVEEEDSKAATSDYHHSDL